MINEMMEKAVRDKVRWNFYGNLTLEDLWDLPKPNLKELYGILNTELNNISNNKYLIEGSNTNYNNVKLRRDIVDYIIETKISEELNRVEEKNNMLRRQQLEQVRQTKVDASLQDLSLEQIEELISDLK